MTTPIDALTIAGRMDSAATDIACGQVPAGGQADCNAAATHLRTLVAEVARLRAQVAPAGYVLVPVEPTLKMLEDGRWSEYGEETSRLHDVDDEDVRAVWCRMLGAAPVWPVQTVSVASSPAPAQQAEPPEWAGAGAFIQHVQVAAGLAGSTGHWPDEFLAWYKAADWLGEHRAAAVFLGQKLAAQQAESLDLRDDVIATLTYQLEQERALCDERGRRIDELYAQQAEDVLAAAFSWVEEAVEYVNDDARSPSLERDGGALLQRLRDAIKAAPSLTVGGETVGVETSPRTEFVLTELRSALNAMLTFFGMDEDESSKEVFAKARQAYDYAQIVMRPLEPWERQSLEDFRCVVHRWHEKAVAKGYDGVESMCEQAQPAAQPATMRAIGADGKPFQPAAQAEPVAFSHWPLSVPPLSNVPAQGVGLTLMQPACRYISDVLAGDASSGEKHIARTVMHLLPLDALAQAQAAEPLRYERIDALSEAYDTGRAEGCYEFARAIERAHGIGAA